MNLDDALDQLDAIHSHLARAETYHGYRPIALAISGLAGLAAAAAQPWAVADAEPGGFVRYWLVIACACAVLACSLTVVGYVWREDEFARRRTRIVLGQFVPCLFVGAALSLAMTRHGDGPIVYLPGLWAMAYGLGIVASLPYLPRSTGVIAAWYLAWGLGLAWFVEGPVPAGWTVGLPFGLGQLLAAVVLWRAHQEVGS